MTKKNKKRKILEYLETLSFDELVNVIDWHKLTSVDLVPEGYDNTFKSGLQYAIDRFDRSDMVADKQKTESAIDIHFGDF